MTSRMIALCASVLPVLLACSGGPTDATAGATSIDEPDGAASAGNDGREIAGDGGTLVSDAHVDAADAARPVLPFPPVPEDDPTAGRNTHAYDAAVGHPRDASEKAAFLASVKLAARAMQAKHGAPACVIGGMSAVESGYGFTRIGYEANNLFGLKYWNPSDPAGARAGIATYLLRGQPDEAFDGSVIVTRDLGTDRKIFNEARRYDNRYLVFATRESAVTYLVEDRFMGARLAPFLDRYRASVAAGMNVATAARRFLFEIAAPVMPGRVTDGAGNDEFYQVARQVNGKTVYGGGGYCHLGGTYYRTLIGSAITAHALDSWCAP